MAVPAVVYIHVVDKITDIDSNVSSQNAKTFKFCVENCTQISCMHNAQYYAQILDMPLLEAGFSTVV